MALANENINIIKELMRLGLCEDYWKIIKVLTPSDINRGQCRLLLQRGDVEKHILLSMRRSNSDKCSSAEGLIIKVWDIEDESRPFELCLKQQPSDKSYVLDGQWIADFVTRKGLEVGDKVGLEYLGSQLHFKHLENCN